MYWKYLLRHVYIITISYNNLSSDLSVYWSIPIFLKSLIVSVVKLQFTSINP